MRTCFYKNHGNQKNRTEDDIESPKKRREVELKLEASHSLEGDKGEAQEREVRRRGKGRRTKNRGEGRPGRLWNTPTIERKDAHRGAR